MMVRLILLIAAVFVTAAPGLGAEVKTTLAIHNQPLTVAAARALLWLDTLLERQMPEMDPLTKLIIGQPQFALCHVAEIGALARVAKARLVQPVATCFPLGEPMVQNRFLADLEKQVSAQLSEKQALPMAKGDEAPDAEIRIELAAFTIGKPQTFLSALNEKYGGTSEVRRCEVYCNVFVAKPGKDDVRAAFGTYLRMGAKSADESGKVAEKTAARIIEVLAAAKERDTPNTLGFSKKKKEVD